MLILLYYLLSWTVLSLLISLFLLHSLSDSHLYLVSVFLIGFYLFVMFSLITAMKSEKNSTVWWRGICNKRYSTVYYRFPQLSLKGALTKLSTAFLHVIVKEKNLLHFLTFCSFTHEDKSLQFIRKVNILFFKTI